MKFIIRQTFPLLIVFLTGVFLISCSPDRKLAGNFAKSKLQRSVLLLQPKFVYKVSLKTHVPDSLNIKDKSLYDSVLMAHSNILRYINDSLFIANYMLGLNKELRKFHFTIYTAEQTAKFMETDTAAYIVNVAQLEIDENIFPYRDETQVDDSYYYHDHKLNSITVDSWFEISEVNDNKKDNRVYYASDEITDNLLGEFTQDIFTGEIKYFYTIDSLKPGDVYNFAYQLGRSYAGYTFDVLMNKFVKDHLASGEKEKKYWRFDPRAQKLFEATTDKFIPLKK